LDQGPIRLKARIVSSNLMRCYSSWFSLRFRRSYSPTLYHSAASDVLANFLRLSKFRSRVNLFLNFLWDFSRTVRSRLTVHKSAKCQNIHTAQNPPRSLGFFFDCSDLGLDSAGLGSLPRSNAWTALRLPFARLTGQRCEALYYSVRIPCFSLSCKPAAHYDFLRVSTAAQSCNLRTLLKTCDSCWKLRFSQ
jgi:hypothetical protein